MQEKEWIFKRSTPQTGKVSLFTMALVGCDQMTDSPAGGDQTTDSPADSPVGYTPVDDGNTFLIYGYNVISSAYINRNDVKMGRPVLDLDKVNTAGLMV
jgi:hypothetical protein